VGTQLVDDAGRIVGTTTFQGLNSDPSSLSFNTRISDTGQNGLQPWTSFNALQEKYGNLSLRVNDAGHAGVAAHNTAFDNLGGGSGTRGSESSRSASGVDESRRGSTKAQASRITSGGGTGPSVSNIGSPTPKTIRSGAGAVGSSITSLNGIKEKKTLLGE
jgi:hypothetical protein